MYNQNLGDSHYYQDQVVKIENGGLFNKERCTELTRYMYHHIGNYLKCTMITKTECCRPSLLARCSWISTAP